MGAFSLTGRRRSTGWNRPSPLRGCPLSRTRGRRISAFWPFTAYLDPWHCRTMNISRGGLFTYFAWFFRDVYGLKFYIPEEFSRSLQSMGLLRWNDEL